MIDHVPYELPPSVAALPQETRDAMGRALTAEIVAAINRLAEEPAVRSASTAGATVDVVKACDPVEGDPEDPLRPGVPGDC